MRTKKLIIIETFLLNQEKKGVEILDYITTHWGSILENNVRNEKKKYAWFMKVSSTLCYKVYTCTTISWSDLNGTERGVSDRAPVIHKFLKLTF